MADTRKKNANWTLNVDENGRVSGGDAKLAVLMDIRDELQENNRLQRRIADYLGCHRIQDMFKAINRIDKRLAKKLPLKDQK